MCPPALGPRSLVFRLLGGFCQVLLQLVQAHTFLLEEFSVSVHVGHASLRSSRLTRDPAANGRVTVTTVADFD
jgi:hypothetical protein